MSTREAVDIYSESKEQGTFLWTRNKTRVSVSVPSLSVMNVKRYTKWPVFVKPVLNIGPLEVVTPSLSSASTDGAILQGWKKTAIILFCAAEDMWKNMETLAY